MTEEKRKLLSKLQTITIFDNKNTKTNRAVCTSYKNINNLFSPSSLFIESLIEFICSLVEKDPSSQEELYLTICRKLHDLQLIDDSYQVSDFDFIRNNYKKELYRLVVAAKSVKSLGNDYAPVPAAPSTGRPYCKLFQWSRYATEYNELEFIARGGFGEVVKAQNKLDAGLYAIKKICIKYCSKNSFFRALSEVQMLAKLTHPNIVSYKAAWLEPLINNQKLSIKKESKPTLYANEKLDSLNNESSEVIFVESESSKKLQRITPSSTEYSSDFSAENGINLMPISEDYDKHIASPSSEVLLFKKKTPRIIHECGQDWAILFIQMQLCDQTLRHWLDERNRLNSPVDIKASLRIFLQIVRGVEFIHSKGIVHHDLKPNNIFLNHSSEEVQVGDFGLSCCLFHDSYSGATPNTTMQTKANPVTLMHQPGEIGTKLYAAPEQLNGFCDLKCDMFSLGILLFELVFPFQTSMERIEKINNLRSETYPADFDEVLPYPSVVVMIKKLVSHELHVRPSALELLTEATDVYEEINSRTDELVSVKQLQEELIQKKQEIKLLKEKLSLLSGIQERVV